MLLVLAALPAAGQAFLPAVCVGCHNAHSAMGGSDLAALPPRFDDRSVRDRWIRVYDRVAKGEMPPKGVPFSAAQRAAMLDPLRRAIHEADHAEVVRGGRGPLRRLNRDEHEQNLQNGVAERWVGSCRREVLDHLIPINEKHLRRLGGDYVAYFHEDRIHDSLAKDTPLHRPVG